MPDTLPRMPARVSVVMVTRDAWEWTERALAALRAHTPEPHEVVVVDNGSADGTPDRVRAAFPEACLVENPGNAGFGPASNQGAEAATGELLCLLNSDALVEPGWLAPLRDAVAGARDVAVAVPCVLELDGRVQCAGALLGRDGSVLEYGNGLPAGDATVAFPRAVDFGPAACMVVDRAAFLSAGGFDDAYAPAYYEDADLCLALAGRGLRTTYVPTARVRHARYGSGNSDAAVALSARNRKVFVARWGDALAAHPATLEPASPSRVLAARDVAADGRVLALAARPPEPGAPFGAALRAVLDARPWARLTLLVGDAAGGEAWRARGAEVLAAPAGEALRARRFHFDAVLADAPAPPLDAVLRDTQPQAARLDAAAVAADAPAALASAGLAPPAG